MENVYYKVSDLKKEKYDKVYDVGMIMGMLTCLTNPDEIQKGIDALSIFGTIKEGGTLITKDTIFYKREGKLNSTL